MQHCGTKRLETERLILRRYVMEDAAAHSNPLILAAIGFNTSPVNHHPVIPARCRKPAMLGQDESNCPLYERDDIEKCLIKDVPAKYFSEITLQVDRATAQPREEKK